MCTRNRITEGSYMDIPTQRDLNLIELRQLWQSRDEYLTVSEMAKLIDLQIAENADLKSKLNNEYRASIGEVWHWQGDGEDHLESLTCPVLISADDMRELIGKRNG